MILYSKTQEENAIEEIVCKEMSKLTVIPMDEGVGRLLMTLLLSSKPLEIPEEEKPFLYSLIEKRVENCFTFKIKETKLILFLALVSESPGKAILYLWYLQYWCYNKNIRELDLNIFCQRIFPNGFFRDKDLKEIWDGQKVIRERAELGSDNLVDYNLAGKSIHFKTS